MEKDKLLTVLWKFKETDISKEELRNVIEQSEDVWNLLASLDNNKFEQSIKIIQKYASTNYNILEIVSLLNSSKYYYKVLSVLHNENAKGAGIALEGAKLINESPNEFNAMYGSYVLCNKEAIESGIALEGAKIINKAPNDFNAMRGRYVLCNKNAIESGIALEGAKIINDSQNAFNAVNADYVLCNKEVIESGIALEGAKLINEAPNDFNASYGAYVLRGKNTIETGIALEGAKHIILANNDSDAKFLTNAFIDESERIINSFRKIENKNKDVNMLVKKLK